MLPCLQFNREKNFSAVRAYYDIMDIWDKKRNKKSQIIKKLMTMQVNIKKLHENNEFNIFVYKMFGCFHFQYFLIF